MPGIAFRETNGYITDASGFSPNIGQAYPTTIGGVVQGWPTNRAASARDRATSSGPKLAGINFVSNGSTAVDYRIDVSPGTYNVRLGLGDATNDQMEQRVVIKDGTTTRATVSAASIATNNFIDAGGVSRVPGLSGSTWDSTNLSVSVVISSGQLILSVGDPGGSGVTTITHIEWTLAGGGDTTAPTLTSPKGTATGATTASGTVNTDEANGTLYYVTTVNASESAATVKAGSSQAVSATGVQNVSRTGLSASTTYRHHFLHRDAAGNDSTVSSSATFTTSAGGDSTPPTLTSPTGTATGATTATGTVSTNEANGTLYYVTTVNASETAATVKAGSSQTVTTTGSQSVSRVGLAASTTYRHHFLHRDAAGNDSTVSSSATFTTSAATGGTLTITTPLCNNTGLISGKWVSQTGITLTVISETTKAGVLVVTGRATNASGVLTSGISDAAITAGQTYRVVPSFGGNAGVSQILTAT